VRNLLVVEDDPVQRRHIAEVMEPIDATTTAVASGEEALTALEDQRFDCVVLDLGLPGMSGWQVIDHLRSKKSLRSIPVLVYTARDLTRKDELRLGRATKTIVVKEVRSAERLREEVNAILQADEDEVAEFPEPGSPASTSIEPALKGKKVLIVDDDIRNIFALTAMLERQQMVVASVDSGIDAIKAVRTDGNIDVALVDVMMPEMDGYETMARMRKLTSFSTRPIIALTAKAMKGDREKCIEAGASDYIAKPVNRANLLSMLRSWLTQ
jgi:CheY-like chemotaxis protein